MKKVANYNSISTLPRWKREQVAQIASRVRNKLSPNYETEIQKKIREFLETPMKVY